MSTISISGNTWLGCEIGLGSFTEIGSAFSKIRESTGNLTSAIGSLKSKIDIASVGTNIEISQDTVKTVKECEESKKGALSNAYQKLERFIKDIGEVDAKVAEKINQRKLDFYARYNYLEPDIERERREKKEEEEKGFWEKVGDVCTGAYEWVADKVDKVCTWCREHWKAIATVVIVIVAVVLICTGVGGPLGAAAIGALIGAGTGGLFGGIMQAANGGSFWKGFEEGAFSGAISGAIAGAMGFGFTGGVKGASLTFGQTVLTGAVSSGGSSLISDLGDKFIKGEDISFGDIVLNTLFSAGTGAVLSGVSYGLGKAFSAFKQKMFPSKDLQNAPYIKDGKPNGRPGPTGKAKDDFLTELFEKQVGKDGVLRDPNTKEIIPWKPGEPMRNIVDVGHKSGKEYAKVFAKYQSGRWSLDKLKSFQSNPRNFYLESAGSNRSHIFEGSWFDSISGKNFPWLNVITGNLIGSN